MASTAVKYLYELLSKRNPQVKGQTIAEVSVVSPSLCNVQVEYSKNPMSAHQRREEIVSTRPDWHLPGFYLNLCIVVGQVFDDALPNVINLFNCRIKIFLCQ